MKKFTLIALAIMASATSFAQTTLWSGEDKGLGSKGDVWDRCNPVVVGNPNKDAVNSSDKCLKITITGKEWDNGSLAFGLPTGTSFASKRLSLKIKKGDNTNVKVELTCKDGDNKTYKKVATWYDGAGEWRKLYFDFSTNGNVDTPIEIAIYPTTDNVEGSKEVYVDDIQIEDLPKVGDKVLTEITDNSLTGNIQLYGTWLKGVCQNVEGDWIEVKYDDFSTLNAKLSKNVTSIKMSEATTKDVDIKQFFKNPNTIVYANANDTYKDHANVVIAGKAASVTLNDAYAFNIPSGFDATTVTLTRKLQGGINSFVLPFWVNAEDLKSTSLATYSSENSESSENVVFDKKDAVDANVPFITVGYSKAEGAGEELTWSNKGFVATPTEFTAPFKGVYAPQSAEGLYGINANGDLQIGGTDAKIKAFHAYYELAAGQAAPAKISFEGEATGINSVAAATVANGAVYDLSGRRVAEKLAGASLVKGIYVVNGKKVVVK